MSIAEKLRRISQNEPEVYKAGLTGVVQNITPASIDSNCLFYI